MKEKFKVTGMTCSACSSRVEKTVTKIDGTREVSVNLLTGSMQVEFDQEKTGSDEIIKAVEKAGYGAFIDEGPGTGKAGGGRSSSAERGGSASQAALDLSLIHI